MILQIGDRVRIISKISANKGRIGTIVKIFSTRGEVKVQIDDGGCHLYSRFSIEKITDFKNDKLNLEEKRNMNTKITGNFRIAKVRFIEGLNVVKSYNFALFDDDVEVNDKVLVNSKNGYGITTVLAIEDKNSFTGEEPTAEVICKVNFEAYEQRLRDREEKKALKKEMDKILKDSQELLLYQTVANNNPAMAELLERYKALSDV